MSTLDQTPIRVLQTERFYLFCMKLNVYECGRMLVRRTIIIESARRTWKRSYNEGDRNIYSLTVPRFAPTPLSNTIKELSDMIKFLDCFIWKYYLFLILFYYTFFNEPKLVLTYEALHIDVLCTILWCEISKSNKTQIFCMRCPLSFEGYV